MDAIQNLTASFAQGNYRNLATQYIPEQRAVWCHMRPSFRPCCTPELLSELQQFHHSVSQSVANDQENGKHDGIRFLVMASRVPGVFNLGGDLALFLTLIRAGDRIGLHQYARSCIDLLHIGYHMPITTIALVQGDAFGGGFEGALTCRVLIAEKKAQMGLPEILFNLFPGMGAYSLLARRLDPMRAERLILSGRMYSAEELFEMGVVDYLAENGEGEDVVHAYMKQHNRAHIGHESIHKIRQVYHPISYDELMRIADIWVDAALQLSERDLRIMERIAKTQEKLAVLRPSAVVQQLA
ncbi:MAG: crotonase/enoyl-CoA hydratase family protein [Gammaproteobacteria bacterium]|nr:crotonase/enoyl-CoA hydratase family protein [Gammaproteobacteria bacterium]